MLTRPPDANCFSEKPQSNLKNTIPVPDDTLIPN